MSSITLPNVCDRGAARALHLDIRDAIGDVPLAIDASKVEKVGQAMLQVIVSAAESEAGITIEEPSDALIEALRLTGLDKSLAKEITKEPAA